MTGLRARRQRSAPRHQHLLAEVVAIHRQRGASYGRRRMSAELRRRHYDVGPFQARRLMPLQRADQLVRKSHDPVLAPPFRRAPQRPDAGNPNP